MRLHLFAATLAILVGAPALAAQQDSSLITLDRLFNSDDFSQDFFGPARWLGDSGYTTFEAAPQGRGRDLVRTDPATGQKQVLLAASRLIPTGDSLPLPVENFTVSSDGKQVLIYTNSQRVWRQKTRGDYWVLEVATGKLRKLGGPEAKPSTLMFAKLSPQGDRVAYVRENNLYVERLKDGKITQLTKDGSRTTINGTFDWVYEEEFDDRDGFRWSPDGKRIAYWQLDASGVRDFLLINNTDSLYSFTKPVQYPKAGTTNSSCRVGVVDANGGKTRWLETPGDPRNTYIARMEWAANSDEVVLQHLNRLQNTLQLMLGDAKSGKVRTILTDQDSAWVDVVDDMRWLDGGKRFTWVTERDGWRHMYNVARDGSDPRLITPGNLDIAQVLTIDDKGGWVYYLASPDNPTQRYLYRAKLDGSAPAERLTPADQPGTHNYSIAPGAAWAFHYYSSFGVPTVTELVHLPDHKVVRTLVDNAKLKTAVAQLKRGPMNFFRVDAGQGVTLDGYVMRPPGFDSTLKYPVLFTVYGEPAAQTVVDTWGYDDYLWHLMLTQRGYVVMSLDNRGTPSLRGREWRKCIYRKVGVLASEDQADAARAIGRWKWVDSTRLGIWGWSGGGSTTLNVLFRDPEVYRMGMAVAPVPDVHLYDTIYQERYMGLPQQNEEDYKRSSPLNFAANLKAKLLVVHGSGDDNVHYQGTERLINALVAANRPFTMMEYPNRTHGIFEGEGTTLHLYSLLTRFVEENLPAGGH
jgi:dipeptidyl-peptidase-4